MLESKLCYSITVTKMVGFIKTCNKYPRRFNFGDFFSSPVKFRSKYNHSFANYGYLLYAVLKALSGFWETRAHEAWDAVTIFSHYYVVVIECLWCWRTPHLQVARLKTTVQIQLALHSCDPIFINNLNMTANSVEKHCYVVLVQIRFKMFCWLLEHYVVLLSWTVLLTHFVSLEIFADPRN